MNTLIFSIIFGSIGLAYFIYGKKQQRVVPLITGLLLSVFPYFMSGAIAMSIVGTILTALPWVVRDPA